MTPRPRPIPPRSIAASHLRAALVSLALLTAAAAPRLVAAAPIWLPPDPSGWPGAITDERDVSPYLAFHKAYAMRAAAARAGAVRTVATPNQQQYDARTYDLDIDADFATTTVTGSVRMRATVTSGPLSTLELDLGDSMTADSVRIAGAPASFSHASAVLTVLLDRAYATGETVDLTVWYHGVPIGGAFGSVFGFDSHNAQPLLWTLSEAFGAREWWPCKDAPEDKADSVTVRVRVPSGMVTVCNGTQLSASDDGLHATTQWKERHPIATYLVSIASYAYTTATDWYRSSPTDSMPIRFYMFPEYATGAAAVNAKVKGMIAAYAARFGAYPFQDEKYGEAQFTWGGGMENQTITSLGGYWESVVAHELGHQWWGDMVTCRDFHHIWLNEGFATYCEALWDEAKGGLVAYQSNITHDRYFGAGTVWAPDEHDENRVFDSNLSYAKGGYVLHMLRHVMTDTLFFQALRAYGAQFRYGTATTEDFRDVCSAVGGRDLGKFFAQWIYGEYYPQYSYGWSSQSATGGGFDVTVVLQQTQGWQLFWMPVDVAVTTGAGTQTFVAWDSLSVQAFTFHVASAPTAVQLDKDTWILRSIGSTTVDVAPPAATRLELAAPWPNPTRDGVVLSFALARAGAVRMRIFDVRGALVWERAEPHAAAGPHQLAWDGRAASGRAAPVGMYAVQLDTAEGSRVRRIVVVR